MIDLLSIHDEISATCSLFITIIKNTLFTLGGKSGFGMVNWTYNVGLSLPKAVFQEFFLQGFTSKSLHQEYENIEYMANNVFSKIRNILETKLLNSRVKLDFAQFPSKALISLTYRSSLFKIENYWNRQTSGYFMPIKIS